jgi:hypothetical protein
MDFSNGSESGPNCLLHEGRSGAEGRNRTADTTIFSRMLYRLSYLGTEAKCILRGLFVHVNNSNELKVTSSE